MKRRARGREVNGIVLLDKPVGFSSNQALQQVKRLFQAQKAGHTGSLDNLASGLLPLCLGEATKIAGYLLEADKRYRVECTLGTVTATGDAEGEVLRSAPVEGIGLSQVAAAAQRFIGEIEQIPPMYSALKRDGQPLYKLARQGITVEREPRAVTIHALEIVRFDGQRVELDVRCSKGTYIRTLAEDLGDALGCGAYVSALRRTGVGAYTEDQMVTMAELEAQSAEGGPVSLDRFLLPLSEALGHWPSIHLSADMAHYVRQGQPVQVPRAPTSGMVRLFHGQDRFLGIGEVQDDGRVAPRRLLHG
jgi:tRNA pseudouridine55 synthase